jgi:hypothetical protein
MGWGSGILGPGTGIRDPEKSIAGVQIHAFLKQSSGSGMFITDLYFYQSRNKNDRMEKKNFTNYFIFGQVPYRK